MAFVYGVLYRASFTSPDRPYVHHSRYLVFLTTIPAIFASIYHESVGIAGLHYIALGAGLSLASQVNGRFMDRIYIHFKNKNGGVGEPEFRLREWVSLISFFHLLTSVSLASMVPGSILLPLGILLAGWSAEHRLHWIATDIVSRSCVYRV